MSKVIECFFLEPIEEVNIVLRRYRFTEGEQAHYHDAEVFVRREPKTKDYSGYEIDSDKTHPLWPKHCECGYVFQDEDRWQTLARSLYKRSDTGELTTLGQAPVGAMWDAPWYSDVFKKNKDGKVLVLRTPGGDWIIDGPSSNGNGWTRTGVPPKITANPSIGMGKPKGKGDWDYHGWLRNGQLVEC